MLPIIFFFLKNDTDIQNHTLQYHKNLFDGILCYKPELPQLILKQKKLKELENYVLFVT